jgi:hypothetical protein
MGSWDPAPTDASAFNGQPVRDLVSTPVEAPASGWSPPLETNRVKLPAQGPLEDSIR